MTSPSMTTCTKCNGLRIDGSPCPCDAAEALRAGSPTAQELTAEALRTGSPTAREMIDELTPEERKMLTERVMRRRAMTRLGKKPADPAPFTNEQIGAIVGGVIGATVGFALPSLMKKDRK